MTILHALDQRDYWNGQAAQKNFTTDFQQEAFFDVVPRSAQVLDVGCGYGRVLRLLAETGYDRLTGVDVSQALIDRGHKERPDLDLRVQSDLGILAFDSATFDAVLLCAVLTCIPEDAEQTRLMNEIVRVLKPGGILYCNDFLVNEDSRNLVRYRQALSEFGTYGVFRLPDGVVLRHHLESHIEELFRPFRPLRKEQVTYRTMNGHFSRGFYYLGVAKKLE